MRAFVLPAACRAKTAVSKSLPPSLRVQATREPASASCGVTASVPPMYGRAVPTRTVFALLPSLWASRRHLRFTQAKWLESWANARIGVFVTRRLRAAVGFAPAAGTARDVAQATAKAAPTRVRP